MKAWEAGAYLTAIEAIGDLHFKHYARNGGTANLIIGVSAYAGLQAVLIKAFQTNDLAITNGYWDGFSTLLNTGIGLSIGEELTPKKLAGLALLSAGMLLL